MNTTKLVTAYDEVSHESQKADPSITQSLGAVVASSVEALLFSSSRPLSLEDIHIILKEEYDIPISWVENSIRTLRDWYQLHSKGFELIDVGGGNYVLRTKKEYAHIVERLHVGRRQEKLSQSALETLACIAFKQPITRIEVEAIRGVDCSGIIQHLMERGLIEIAGRKESPGRPSLYRTTPLFLTYFGVDSIETLKDKLNHKE